MASVTTTTISQASALGHSPRVIQPNFGQNDGGLQQSRDPQRVAQISQVAANSSTKSMETSSSRSIQTPPRAEGSFQESKKKGAEEGKDEGSNESLPKGKLNMKV